MSKIVTKSLLNRLENRQRIGFDEAMELYDMDIFTVAHYANQIREQKFGRKTYFNINRHINPTNICKDVCLFCAYSASRKNPNPYTMKHEEIVKIAKAMADKGATEIHIVSAHNKEVSLDWYLDIYKKVKAVVPDIHIKSLTGAEVDFLAHQHGKSYDEMIDLMIESGVDSMPGGGAEIFDERVRKKICHGKVTSDNWLKIHEKWHNKGGKSTSTMLFGHIEQREHRIDHMLRLRNLQDKTGGFNTFIPLVYQRDNNFLKVKQFPTGQEILKTFAIARILLDNIPTIKAYWATLSMNLALVAQEFGANDIDGTIEKESIQSAAGAKSAGGLDLDTLIHQIKDSGFIPVERDSLYNELRVW